MILKDRWLHESGGLVWHWRALRHGRRLWQPFIHDVSGWLDGWRPPTRDLVLIGPSAGYTLDPSFLRRWHRVVAIEPDPLARTLLKQRGGREFRFDDIDILSPHGPATLAARYPTHAILFCNVLGQIAPREASAGSQFFGGLREALARHHWASYHDLASTTRAPDMPESRPAHGVMQDMNGVLNFFWQEGELEIVDHGTFGLGDVSAATSRAWATWALRPGHWHLVEWLAMSPARMPAEAGKEWAR